MAKSYLLSVFCLLAMFQATVQAQGGAVFSSEKETFKIEVVASGLDHPWGMEQLPDGRLLVTERSGRLRLIEHGKLNPNPVEGLPPIFAVGEGGLLDVKLHPDYAKNGWIYLVGTTNLEKLAMTTIFRGKLEGNRLTHVETIYTPPAADFMRAYNHFGGRLAFVDGYLYLAIGDRGARANPDNPAQKLDSARGKIHRFKDDGSIPEDNPYVHTPGALPSIWTWGHRNPEGLRVQPGTNLLWEAEHGPRGGDEVNIIKKGANYGWPLVTYGTNDDGTVITDKRSLPGMEDPVTQWTPSIAISGIDFYEGDKFPGWKGDLFATALRGQKLVRNELDANNHVTHQEAILEGTGRMREVRCLGDGALYILYDWPGNIIRLVPAR